MISDLHCECCGELLHSDFSSNVFCKNEECLLHTKTFSYDFIYGRKLDREAGRPLQTKERMAQGWAYEFGIEKREKVDPNAGEFFELQVGVEVEYIDIDNKKETGIIEKVLAKHVQVGVLTIPKSHVKVI